MSSFLSPCILMLAINRSTFHLNVQLDKKKKMCIQWNNGILVTLLVQVQQQPILSEQFTFYIPKCFMYQNANAIFVTIREICVYSKTNGLYLLFMSQTQFVVLCLIMSEVAVNFYDTSCNYLKMEGKS